MGDGFTIQGDRVEYKQLGTTGIVVSRYCLGTMMLGRWGNTDRPECVAMVRAALDAGINYLDSSDVYSFGESEEIIGEAVAGRRDDVVITTKFTNPMSDNLLHRGGSRRWIMQACEASLRRLGTDYIDVYLQHRHDDLGDLDETLGALSDLVHQGKVRTYGTSNHPVEAIVEAQWIAERRCYQRPKVQQSPYSMLVRFNERDLLPTCSRFGQGVMLWSPLAGGWLTGAVGRDKPRPDLGAFRDPRRYDVEAPENQSKFDALERLEALAASAGLSLVDMGLAFVREHPSVTAAIVGPATPTELEGILAGADLRLSDDVLDEIDRIVPPGTNLNEADRGATSPTLAAWRRRGSAASISDGWRPADGRRS